MHVPTFWRIKIRSFFYCIYILHFRKEKVKHIILGFLLICFSVVMLFNYYYFIFVICVCVGFFFFFVITRFLHRFFLGLITSFCNPFLSSAEKRLKWDFLNKICLVCCLSSFDVIDWMLTDSFDFSRTICPMPTNFCTKHP